MTNAHKILFIAPHAMNNTKQFHAFVITCVLFK